MFNLVGENFYIDMFCGGIEGKIFFIELKLSKYILFGLLNLKESVVKVIFLLCCESILFFSLKWILNFIVFFFVFLE